MRRNLSVLIGVGLIVALAPLTASAQVPSQIPIQGYITEADGTPYDAEVAIRFNLYDAPTGGTELYSERVSIPVDRGVFTAYLGAATALDMGIFADNTDVYLGLQVGADAEATPRLMFGSVPFAAMAGMAGNFGGVDAADFPTTIEEWALAACPDTIEELTAILDAVYANPAWDAITGIPEDIADGDDGFTTEEELTALLDDNYATPAWGDIVGIPADIADGDDGFTTEEELAALLDDNYRGADWAPSWDDIVGIPADIADGDGVVSAGAGLNLDGETLSVLFGDDGEEDVAARADTVEALQATVAELEEQILAMSENPRPGLVPYRWAMFSTYDQHGGQWAMGNRADMFGGVTPQHWTDGNYRPVHMSRNSDVIRTLMHRRGYASPNTVMIAQNFHMYSSTTGWVYLVLFRIRNTTDSVITWRPRTWVTAYGGWNEWAGLAINGTELWNSGGTWYRANFNYTPTINLPADEVSTVIFSSTTSPASGNMRFLQMAFDNNALDLPDGLEAIDDLDTFEGNLW